MLRVATDEPTREHTPSMLDEIVREGDRRMLTAVLEAKVAAYVDAHADDRDEDGRRMVVRNGRRAEVTTGTGPMLRHALERCASHVGMPRARALPASQLTIVMDCDLAKLTCNLRIHMGVQTGCLWRPARRG